MHSLKSVRVNEGRGQAKQVPQTAIKVRYAGRAEHKDSRHVDVGRLLFLRLPNSSAFWSVSRVAHDFFSDVSAEVSVSEDSRWGRNFEKTRFAREE